MPVLRNSRRLDHTAMTATPVSAIVMCVLFVLVPGLRAEQQRTGEPATRTGRSGQAASTRVTRSEQAAKPDIEGAWERYGMFFGPRGNAPQLPNVPPPAMPPPLKAQYRAEWQEAVQRSRDADAKGQPLATGYTSCLPDGMPSMMAAMFPLEVLVSKGRVTIIEEAFNQVRRIAMNQPQKALEDVEPGFFGHSVGRWEGDTLLVDTIGIKENVRYQNTPHSSQMRIRERIRLVAPDILWDEITIEDPVTLERPWVVTYAYKRMKDYTLLEYVCEDNREFADEQGRQRIRIGPRKD